MMPDRSAHVPVTRVVGYAYEGMDESAAERILKPAKEAGVVTQFDGGTGFVWFNGPPGKALREVRDKVAALPGARMVRR